jgi:hypothetical protein
LVPGCRCAAGQSAEVATGQSDTGPADELTEERGDSPDGGGGNREAAKYRRQLRDAESQRDALSDRLLTLQRREAERLAAEHLADGADMWRDGLDLAALLDDHGNLDPRQGRRRSTHHRQGAPALGRAPTAEAQPGGQRRRPQKRCDWRRSSPGDLMAEDPEHNSGRRLTGEIEPTRR